MSTYTHTYIYTYIHIHMHTRITDMPCRNIYILTPCKLQLFIEDAEDATPPSLPCDSGAAICVGAANTRIGRFLAGGNLRSLPRLTGMNVGLSFHTHKCIHTCAGMRAHAHTHGHTHAHAHAYIQTRTQTYAYVHTHLHTHTRTLMQINT